MQILRSVLFGRSGRSPWFVSVVIVAVMLGLGQVIAVAQDDVSSPIVPSVPPWRSELIPRERPLTVTVGETPVEVEVANDNINRSLGLGYRDGLPPGTGMLFVFDNEPDTQNFWMGPMRFCLDIIWINGDEITGAAESTCPGPFGGPQDLIPRHQSPGPAEFVLEVPAGFLAQNGYGTGTTVMFSEDPYGIPVPDQS